MLTVARRTSGGTLARRGRNIVAAAVAAIGGPAILERSARATPPPAPNILESGYSYDVGLVFWVNWDTYSGSSSDLMYVYGHKGDVSDTTTGFSNISPYYTYVWADGMSEIQDASFQDSGTAYHFYLQAYVPEDAPDSWSDAASFEVDVP